MWRSSPVPTSSPVRVPVVVLLPGRSIVPEATSAPAPSMVTAATSAVTAFKETITYLFFFVKIRNNKKYLLAQNFRIF